MNDFLLKTSLEDIIRVSTLICVLLSMRLLSQIIQLLKQNRQKINYLTATVDQARMTKALRFNDYAEQAKLTIVAKTDENDDDTGGEPA